MKALSSDGKILIFQGINDDIIEIYITINKLTLSNALFHYLETNTKIFHILLNTAIITNPDILNIKKYFLFDYFFFALASIPNPGTKRRNF